MKNKILAFDCDGVLLDYNQSFYNAYKKAFEKELQIVMPGAYHAVNEFGMQNIPKEEMKVILDKLCNVGLWSDMPALNNTLNVINTLSNNYEIICITSMPKKYEEERFNNLKNLGFNISTVYATERVNKTDNPKKDCIEKINPIIFVDDLLSNFENVNCDTKLIYLNNGQPDSPNVGKENNSHYTIKELSEVIDIVTILERKQYFKHF